MSDADPPAAAPSPVWAWALGAYLLLTPWLVACAVRWQDEGLLSIAAIAAALCLPAAWLLARALAAEPEGDAAQRARGGGGGLLAATAAALLMRLLWLDTAPLAIDTDVAQAALLGDRLLADGGLQLVADELVKGIETAFHYTVGLSLRAFGVSVWSLRLPGALIGALSVPALFLFARELFGARAALITSWLCALAPWPVLMSRSPKHSLLVIPALCLGYAALLWALRRGGWGRYLVAGLLIGSGMHTYMSYRHGAVVAIGFALLHRWRWPPEGDGHGWPSWAALLGGCLLTAGVVLLEAGENPGGWLEPIARNEIVLELGSHLGLAEAPDARPPSLLVWQLATVCANLLLVQTSHQLGPEVLLGLAALAAWLALASRARSDPRGALLTWLALWMLLPPVLARYHILAPRRAVALLPLLLTLAAFGLDRWWRLPGWLGRLGAAATLGLIALLGLRSLALLAQLARPEPSEQLARELLLREAVRLADAGATVAIADGSAGADDRLRFFLLHPRIIELPGDEPCALLVRVPPGDPVGAVVLAHDDGLPARLRATRGAGLQLETRPLPIGEPLTAWRLPPAWLAAVRGPAEARDALPPGPSDWFAPADGRYRLTIQADGPGRLLAADGARLLELAAAGEVSVETPLARGVNALRLLARAGARWQLRGARLGAETEALRRVHVDERAPRAAPISGTRLGALRRLDERERHVAVEGPLRKHRDPQDLTALADGTLIVATVAGPIALRSDGEAPHPSWRAREADGQPLRQPFSYEHDPAKLWSVAALGQRLLVSDRRGRRVLLLGPSGALERELTPPEGAWQDPVDVAARDGRLAICDRGRGEVLVTDADGTPRARHPVADPIACAWLRDGEALRLAVLDLATRRLLLLPATPGQPPRVRPLAPLNARCRLACDDRRLAVIQPRRATFYDAQLARLAPAGDPAASLGQPTHGSYVALSWRDGQLWLLDRHAFLHRYELR